MTRRRSIPLLRMALLVGIGWFAGARVAGATCPGVCSPTFDPWGAVVGCCKADCTWKTGTSTARECINPADPCQQGHCSETTHTCDGSYVNPDGHPSCLSSTDHCKVGECYNQACTYIDNKAANGFDDYCDDGNDCKTDGCDATGSTQFIPPTCSHNPVVDMTSCATNPGGTCQVGKCQSGYCVNYPAGDGTDCSTSSGDTCSPKYCQSGACVPNGGDITCPTDGQALGVCRVWNCSWSGSTASCTQVKAPVGMDCDTNSHDCKAQTCLSTGKCGNQGQPLPHACDPNYTQPILSDCTSGACDSRHNCVGITYDPGYDGLACNDGNVCTTASTCDHDTATCRGTACAANTVDCPACNVGNCDPTKGIPNCGCP